MLIRRIATAITSLLYFLPAIATSADLPRKVRVLEARPRPEARRVWSAAGTRSEFRAQALPPFGAGSLGGYWSYAEARMKLDDLVASDVRGVVADRLDTLGWSHGGRPILGLAMGRSVHPRRSLGRAWSP